MPTAELIKGPVADDSVGGPSAAARSKPPRALRPLHRMWRRTIDTIHVSEISLPVRALPPALGGIVACQISDFHVDRDEDLQRLELAVETINAQHPDLVFLTGDYFSGPDTMHRYLPAFRDALKKLSPHSGVFAILGNHDHWSSADKITDALRRSGADVLANESRRLALRGEKMVVVGIDDLWSRRAEPARAFADVGGADCTVVLAHNPDTALYARHLKPGVMLSGHTHGGVVRIPFYGSPLKSILRIGKQFYSGLNRYEDFFIYTNRGLGTFWLRIRINCPPEVSRFTLTPLDERIHGAKADTALRPRPHKPARRRRTPRHVAVTRSRRKRS
ncbi:MAG TPA: metallophosphoesterase [Candidatus Acidoferrales bacterium]|nr:metallophosphoesterase [Candidatus Acidoferrales bacterium]